MACATSSTTIFSTITEDQKIEIRQYSKLSASTDPDSKEDEKDFAIFYPKFSCSNPACCSKLTYEISANNLFPMKNINDKVCSYSLKFRNH